MPNHNLLKLNSIQYTNAFNHFFLIESHFDRNICLRSILMAHASKLDEYFDFLKLLEELSPCLQSLTAMLLSKALIEKQFSFLGNS
jgi:hypothetical protein